MNHRDLCFGEHLKDFLDRLIRLEEVKVKLKQDLDQIYRDAKLMGYDIKALRKRGDPESAGDHLQSYLARLLRLEAHKKDFDHSFRQVYREAKKLGFDVKVLKKFIHLQIKRAYDCAYDSDALMAYKHALEAEDERLFLTDPERFKSFYFHKWLELNAKFRL